MIREKCIWYDKLPDNDGIVDYCIILQSELEDCGNCRDYNKPIMEERRCIFYDKFKN